jgi:hypothetical protein
MVKRIQDQFEAAQSKITYKTEWTLLTLAYVVEKNPGKSKTEYLEILLGKLEELHKTLPTVGQGLDTFHDQVYHTCFDVPEYEQMILNLTQAYKGLHHQIRMAITVSERKQTLCQFNQELDKLAK